MDTINVLVTMPFPKDLMEKLHGVSPRLSVMQYEVKSEEDLADQDLSNIEIMYGLWALPVPEEAPHLKWVQLHSAGVDHLLDHPLYTETDVTFTTVSGIHAVPMAEYALAQMMAFAHHIPKMLADKRQRKWTKGRWERYVPRELRGKTLGIVGYGSIGRELARLAQAAGMTVLATKRNVRSLSHESYRIEGTGDPDAEIPDRIYPTEALNSFLGECDFVVLTAPLTDETRHLIDAEALAHMKPDAVLVNVSRGDIVDEYALIDALEEQKIGGAALDVFHEEPLPEDSPLWGLENVILSPHVAGFTPAYDDRVTDVFAENLRRYVVGEELMNVVRRERDY